MTRNRRLLIGLSLVAAALILLFLAMPLRMALGWSGLDRHGVTARGAEGTVWDGEIESLKFGQFEFGNVSAGLRFWPLFLGRTHFEIGRAEEPGFPAVRAAFGANPGGFMLDDATAMVGVGPIFAPLPIDRLELQDLAVRFEDGACAEASGNVRALLLPDLGGVTLPPDGLLGGARCDGAAVHVPMSGASGMEQVDLRIFADGNYSARLRLTGDRAEEAELLAAAGFRPVAGAYILEMEGSF